MGLAAKVISSISQKVKRTLVVHGNGPQVGWMLRRAEIALKHNMHPVPLGNIVAASQGAIGASLATQVVNADLALDRWIVEVGTHVLVDKNDIAFFDPTKPIGNFMHKEEAEKRMHEDQWVVKQCAGGPDGKEWRRVVPSPEPLEIAEIDSIQTLIRNQIIPICVGGGGIPYVVDDDGKRKWVEAVIDKDKAAALAALELGMDMLTIFTGTEGIYDPDDFKRKCRGDSSVRVRETITPQELREMIPSLPAGSMRPKAEACARFTEKSGNPSWIGPLHSGFEALTEGGGTIVEK